MCKVTRFKTVLNLGRNPLVNSLLDKENLHQTQPTHPLVVKQCQNCFLIQLTTVADTRQIYKDVDYPYFSSDMPNLTQYFAELAADIKRRFLDPQDLFVEIGSNDGMLLDLIKDTARVLGVDPATTVTLRALKRGLPTITEFFSERLAKQIRSEWGKAKVILGANSIAHLNDLHDLIRGVVALLRDDGVFIMEANYWGGMVEKKNYALIYHDHLSYFTLKNWVDFAPRFGLEPFDALVTEAQGSSLRVFMGRGYSKTERFDRLLLKEVTETLHSYRTVQKYATAARREAYRLGTLVRTLKKKGQRIAAYGAAAKGFSVLKLSGLDEKHIDYFVDDSPAKQGKYTPVSHIPIISRREAKLPHYFLITAPNYEDVIIAKEAEYRKSGGKFITIDGRIIGSQPEMPDDIGQPPRTSFSVHMRGLDHASTERASVPTASQLSEPRALP